MPRTIQLPKALTLAEWEKNVGDSAKKARAEAGAALKELRRAFRADACGRWFSYDWTEQLDKADDVAERIELIQLARKELKAVDKVREAAEAVEAAAKKDQAAFRKQKLEAAAEHAEKVESEAKKLAKGVDEFADDALLKLKKRMHAARDAKEAREKKTGGSPSIAAREPRLPALLSQLQLTSAQGENLAKKLFKIDKEEDGGAGETRLTLIRSMYGNLSSTEGWCDQIAGILGRYDETKELSGRFREFLGFDYPQVSATNAEEAQKIAFKRTKALMNLASGLRELTGG